MAVRDCNGEEIPRYPLGKVSARLLRPGEWISKDLIGAEVKTPRQVACSLCLPLLMVMTSIENQFKLLTCFYYSNGH